MFLVDSLLQCSPNFFGKGFDPDATLDPFFEQGPYPTPLEGSGVRTFSPIPVLMDRERPVFTERWRRN